jgi:hypothetical protein
MAPYGGSEMKTVMRLNSTKRVGIVINKFVQLDSFKSNPITVALGLQSGVLTIEPPTQYNNKRSFLRDPENIMRNAKKIIKKG